MKQAKADALTAIFNDAEAEFSHKSTEFLFEITRQRAASIGMEVNAADIAEALQQSANIVDRPAPQIGVSCDISSVPTAELAALREDKARLDYLTFNFPVGAKWWRDWKNAPPNHLPPTLRAAIDLARANFNPNQQNHV